MLLQNQWVENGGTTVIPGQPLFVEVAAAAGVDDLADPGLGRRIPGYRATSGGFFDYDRDGFVDLYVTHWWTEFGGELPNKDRLYRNNGNGTFSEVTDSAGMNDGVTETGHEPARSGDPDRRTIWIRISGRTSMSSTCTTTTRATTISSTRTTPTAPLQRRLRRAPAPHPGLGLHDGAGMGIDVVGRGERRRLGLLRLRSWSATLIDSSNGNAFHTGNGDGTFADNSAVAAGIYGVNSWGVNFFDADLDGFEDLFVGGASATDPRAICSTTI